MEKEVFEESRSDADEHSVEEFEQEFLKQQKKARARNLFLLVIFIMGLAVGGYLSWLRSELAVREPASEVAGTTEPDFLVLDEEPDFTIQPPVKKPASEKPSAVKPLTTAKKPTETMVAKAVSEEKKKPRPVAKTTEKKQVARKATKKPMPVSNAVKQKRPAKETTKISPIEMGKSSAVKQPAVVKKPADAVVAKAVSEAKKKPPPAAKATEKKQVASKAAKKAPVKVAAHKKAGVEKASVSGKPGVSYYLQIGVFSKRIYAQKMADSLKSLGLTPSYREIHISLTDYLVSAGPYDSLEEADEAVKRISQKGYSVKAVKSADGVYRLDFGKFRSGKEVVETASGLEKLGIKAQVEKKRKKLPATMVVVEGIKGKDELEKVTRSLDDKKVKYYVKKSPL
jgi:cell division protein FtsN